MNTWRISITGLNSAYQEVRAASARVAINQCLVGASRGWPPLKEGSELSLHITARKGPKVHKIIRRDPATGAITSVQWAPVSKPIPEGFTAFKSR